MSIASGHGGPHAVMYGGTGSRRVLVWRGHAAPVVPTGDWRSLSWMRGFLSPAWFESTGGGETACAT